MNDTLTLCLEILFWFALFVVFYTYLGYGILLYILVKLKEFFVKPVRRSLPTTDGELPEVTLFITKRRWWTRRWRTALNWTILRISCTSSG